MKSEVYFIEVKARDPEARVEALKKILNKVDPFSAYKKDEIVCNSKYIRKSTYDNFRIHYV